MHNLTNAQLEGFRRDGFVVLRGALDGEALGAEVSAALADGSHGAFGASAGEGGRFLPMMCERTPTSLALLHALAPLAARLLDAPVLPVRAKGVLYFGATGWHRDSERDLPSVGLAAYLEPLDASNGALRVRPGSHVNRIDDLAERVVRTNPGDLIAFDEHLLHASAGGRDRRQWRVDFIADPAGAAAEASAREYYASLFAAGWEGGYDAARYPSYGPHFCASAQSWAARLGELGVLAAAAGR